MYFQLVETGVKRGQKIGWEKEAEVTAVVLNIDRKNENGVLEQMFMLKVKI